MFTFGEALRNAVTAIPAAAGEMIRIGFMLPTDAATFTCARALVVGDLVRRVLEDIHSAQVLAAAITNDCGAADLARRCDLMVRPTIGTFATQADAEVGLGKPLDLIVTVIGTQDEAAPPTPALRVAPVHATVPYPELDPATVRFVLARAPYAQELEMTKSLLVDSHAVLEGWRDRLDQWSRHPSKPVPLDWRSEVIVALDTDLDVTQVVAVMSELEDSEAIEPGTKFEAFSYLDRVLAVDLARNLGRVRR